VYRPPSQISISPPVLVLLKPTHTRTKLIFLCASADKLPQILLHFSNYLHSTLYLSHTYPMYHPAQLLIPKITAAKNAHASRTSCRRGRSISQPKDILTDFCPGVLSRLRQQALQPHTQLNVYGIWTSNDTLNRPTQGSTVLNMQMPVRVANDPT
jgi:hypothetical protein